VVVSSPSGDACLFLVTLGDVFFSFGVGSSSSLSSIILRLVLVRDGFYI